MLFGRDDSGQNLVLALGGLFQHVLVDALLLTGRRIADELRERSRGNSLGFALEQEHGQKV